MSNSPDGPSTSQISVPAAGVTVLPFSGIPLDDIPSTAQKFAAQLDSFAIAEPQIWLEKTFGNTTGASLVPEYQTSLEKFKSHISWVSGNWSNAPDAALAVEVSQLPNPPVSAEEEATLPKPDAAVQIENFRFTIKADKVVESWVFSFVYLDGRFRIVGGTYPFWHEVLQWLRVSVPEQLEGVAYKSPDGSLVRIYVSPQMQAMRLEKRVEPVYPEAARKAGIQGAVVFHAIIAKDGTVKDLSREVGDPILAEAAEKAVCQWRYDEAIYIDPSGDRAQLAEVDTAIAVEFKLPQ
ncbi:MAG: energy transducer TonB [Candidatus Acidiferrales bacterium]